MKKIVIGALTLALLGSAAGAAQAQPYRGGYGDRDHGRYDRDRYDRRGDDRRDYRDDRRSDRWERQQYRRWARGQRLPPGYWSYGVDYRRHHLRRPPNGYRWVQVNNDYVLAAIATGLILEVINGR